MRPAALIPRQRTWWSRKRTLAGSSRCSWTLVASFGLPCRCTHAWEKLFPANQKPRKESLKELNLPKDQTLLESVAKHFLDSKGEKEDGSLKQDSFKARISNLWAKVWNSASL